MNVSSQILFPSRVTLHFCHSCVHLNSIRRGEGWGNVGPKPATPSRNLTHHQLCGSEKNFEKG